MLAFSDMTQVIYARVPESLKEAADTYADERGVTLTSAVVDLMERGLSAISDERSITQLQTKLAKTTAEKASLEATIKGSETELAGLRAFAHQAQRPVGRCPNPNCGSAISGIDLMARGKCQSCQQPLSDLLAPAHKSSTLNQRDVGVLVGALAVVLIAAAMTA